MLSLTYFVNATRDALHQECQIGTQVLHNWQAGSERPVEAAAAELAAGEGVTVEEPVQ